MPRKPRLDLAHVAQHVVQRGNDRQPCFFTADDYRRYLDELREITLRAGCALHAYVLMTNHVHLLMTPTQAGQIAHVMQSLGRRYVRYVNDLHRRTGTLWEGRYKSCLVASDNYLMRCYRYIELNPVRAHMVASPDDYEWSSFHRNANLREDSLVRPHPTYLALGINVEDRAAAYRRFVADTESGPDTDEIRLYLQRQYAFGSTRFQKFIEAQLGRRAGPAKVGRPVKRQKRSDGAESGL
jgi:putative transposase